MSNPYRIKNILETVKDIADGCYDSHTKQRLQDLSLADVKADAWDAGFKEGKIQQNIQRFAYAVQPNVKVVALGQHVIDAAMLFFPSRKIHAIKEVRTQTGMGLRDAKDTVESLFAQEMDRLHQDAIYIGYNYNTKY